MVTITLFQFEKAAHKFWALQGMQRSHKGLSKADGLTFYKLMGSGGDNGFKWYPNFSVYAFLGVWESRAHADSYFHSNDKYIEYQSKSDDCLTVYLKPFKVEGKWGGVAPCEAEVTEPGANLPVAILTRARIRSSQLPDFWQHVPAVARSVKQAEGCRLSIGVGEWPLFEQATFSIWDDYSHTLEYAYRQRAHADIITRTRMRGWYTEEFFARFVIDDIQGQWPGFEPRFQSRAKE